MSDIRTSLKFDLVFVSEQKRTYDRRNPDEKAAAGTQVADADIIALMAKQ